LAVFPISHTGCLFKEPSPTIPCALSLHDALPIYSPSDYSGAKVGARHLVVSDVVPNIITSHFQPIGKLMGHLGVEVVLFHGVVLDRKSTRLNSSHVSISYAGFCLKKNKGANHTLC